MNELALAVPWLGKRYPAAARWVVIAIAVAAPLIAVLFGKTWVRILDFAMLYVMLAIGLNLVVGFAGLLDLGYIAFYAVGAYTFAFLASPHFDIHLPFWLVLPAGAACAALAGIILGLPTLRLRGDYLAIVTLGFGEIVRLLADNLKEVTNGPAGLQGVLFPELGSSADNPDGVFSVQNNHTLNSGIWWYWLALLLVVIVLLFVGNLERSRVGRSWIAIREDEDAAEIMGVPTFKYKLWAFVIGAGIGGLSGAVYAGQVQYVDPKAFTVINSMLFLCAVVIGGQGNKLGVIVGAFIIVYVPARVQGIEVGGQSLGDFKYLFFGLALVTLMIFRPQGLFPARARLITFGRQVYAAAHRVGDAVRHEPGSPSGQKEVTP